VTFAKLSCMSIEVVWFSAFLTSMSFLQIWGLIYKMLVETIQHLILRYSNFSNVHTCESQNELCVC